MNAYRHTHSQVDRPVPLMLLQLPSAGAHTEVRTAVKVHSDLESVNETEERGLGPRTVIGSSIESAKVLAIPEKDYTS